MSENKSLLDSIPEKYRGDMEWMLHTLYMMHLEKGLSIEEADVMVRRGLGSPQRERTRRKGQTPTLRTRTAEYYIRTTEE